MRLIESLEWNNKLKEEYVEKTSINIDNLTVNSSIKLTWRCLKCKGIYKAAIRNRMDKEYKKATHCPYCSNRKILKGFNELVSKRPELLKYWDYEKNTLNPYKIFPKSGVKIYWNCLEHNHTFSQAPRNIKNTPNCPYCNFKKLLKGFNDLETMNKSLLKHFNYELNILKPSEILYLKSTKLWWNCEVGHPSFKSIEKVINGNCKYCINQETIEGFNDLESNNFILTKEWNYKRNKITPKEVNYKSGLKIWWSCPKNHDW